MAEPTEAEQKKQTDLLVGLDARGSNQETQLQKLASIIKEGNAYSVMAHEESMGQENDLMELEAMRESILRKHGKVQEKTLAAIEKQTAEDEKKKTEDKGTEDKKEQGKARWAGAPGADCDAAQREQAQHGHRRQRGSRDEELLLYVEINGHCHHLGVVDQGLGLSRDLAQWRPDLECSLYAGSRR